MVVCEEDQMILDNIDEYIKDEDRIVTYRWLSLTLSINMDKAKSCLEDYYEKFGSELQAIYFVGGLKDDEMLGKMYSCQLTRKEKLQDLINEYNGEVTSHIYSVQKCKLKDSGPLYCNDVDIIKESSDKIPQLSSLQSEVSKVARRKIDTTNGHAAPMNEEMKKHADVKKVSKQEMNLTNKSSAPSNKPSSKHTSHKEAPPLSFFGKKTGKSTGKLTSKDEDNKSKQQDKPKKEEAKHKQSGITGAFSHSKAKNEASKNIDKPTTKPVEDENIKSDKPSKKRKAVINSDSEDEFENFISNNSKNQTTDVSDKQKAVESKDTDSSINVIEATPEPKTKSKTKRRKKEKEEPKETKESDEEKGENNKPSPDNVISISSETSTNSSRNQDSKPAEETRVKTKKRGRRRVMKTKQFLDEDGFMVTKKEYESESYSEESDTDQSKANVVPPKLEKLKKTEKELEKKSAAQNKKAKQQTSLTSFFKKK